MHFTIRQSGTAWEWLLLSEADDVLAESHRTYPSPVQASAAALAWSRMVMRAGKAMGRPEEPGLF